MHGPPLQTIDYGNTQRCSTQIWRGKECFLSGNRKAAKSKQEKKKCLIQHWRIAMCENCDRFGRKATLTLFDLELYQVARAH
jgi:hypothetical protein